MIEFTGAWPPPSEAPRLSRYKRGKQLYKGHHKALYWDTQRIPEELRRASYLVLNYPQIITNVSADLLVLEPPVFEHREELLNELLSELDKDRLAVLLYESTISTAYRGDGVFRLRIDGANVLMEAVPAYNYFVELDCGNCRNVLEEAIAWVEGKDVLRVERHMPGVVVQEAYRYSKGKVGAQLDVTEFLPDGMDPVVEHGYPFSLLVHVPNCRADDEFWGTWDYGGGLESLFREANQRITQIAHILDKHTAPIMVGPRIYGNHEGNIDTNEGYFEAEGEIGAKLPRYLTWDAQLDAAERQLNTVIDHISRVSDVAPAVFGLDSVGNVESAPAMRMRYLRTITKTKRKRLYQGPALKELLRRYLALKVGDKTGSVAPPVIRWRDGLPRDVHQVVQTEVARVTAGLASRQKAIMRIDEVDALTASTEIDQINKERMHGEESIETAPDPTGTSGGAGGIDPTGSVGGAGSE